MEYKFHPLEIVSRYRDPQLQVRDNYPNVLLHPLCGGGDLLFLLTPPAAAAAFCFCSHSKIPTRFISKYFHYAYWPWGICLVIFFLRFLVSST